MLEFSSTESCTTSNTSTPLVGFSSNDSSCDGNVALMNDFESTEGCSGQGPQGPDGFSAYQIAVFDGFVGTETQWLASLVGPGVPVGGTAGQILAKIDLTNYNTQWINNFALPTLTSGSVLFSNGTTLAQNNANFFWNNANNRLGIGTTTPSYALHVNGVTGATTFTIPSYNSQLNQNYLMLYGGYGAGMQGTYNNPTGGDLTFGTFINSIFNEKMRLLPSGNLGIGTTTPNHKLELSSAGYTSLGIFSGANNIAEIVFQNTAYGLPRWTIRSTATPNGSSGNLTFQKLGSTFPFTITNNDTVLIGTTVDNGGKLQIKAGGSASTDIALRVRNSGDTADILNVAGNGFMGIGVATPNNLLNVGYNLANTSPLASIGFNPTSGNIASTNGYLALINIVAADPVAGISTGAMLGFNSSSSNFYGQGIGAIRNSKYDIWYQTGSTNGGGYRWYIGTSEKLTIDYLGNVGIGTTTPTAKLQVKGDGTNTIAIFETSAGALALSVNNSGSAFGFGSGGINLITTNDGTTNVNTGTGLIYRGNVSTSNTTIYSHYFSNNNIRQAISGTIGLVDYNSSFSAGAGSANFRPLNISYTLNNTGAQTGTATGIFLNATETALNGMVHNLMDLQVGGVSKFRAINETFSSKLAITATHYSSLILTSTNYGNTLTLGTQAVNGWGLLALNAANYFFSGNNLIALGGTTNLFPAIKRNGTIVDFRLADDSGYSAINTNKLYMSGQEAITEGSGMWYSSSHPTRYSSFTIGSGQTTVTAMGARLHVSGSWTFADTVEVSSAVVAITSTTKGFLPPRMTTAQKVGIATPATGLVVFDTDLGKLCVFAVTWQTITSV